MLPIDRPGKIICVGLNYRDHAEEQGVDLPKAPLFFAKYTTALIGPGEPIVIPPMVTQCDYEAELGVVIGSPREKRLQGERARSRSSVTSARTTSRPAIFSSRTASGRAASRPTRSARSARSCSASEIPDPHALRIRAIVSGEVLQDSTTANLIFGVDDIISYASLTSTLELGDLILTGTPAGVGIFRDPKRLLQPGDEVTIEIEGIGTLTNPVVAG